MAVKKIKNVWEALKPQAKTVFAAFFSSLSVPPREDLDEWSDRNRILPEGTSSEHGLWRTSRFPFLKEIMKCLSPSSAVKYIDVQKGSQLGFTEVMINWILYTIDHDPGPMLYVQKTSGDVSDFSDQKLQTSIDACPVVADKVNGKRATSGSNKKLLKTFPGGFIALGGAESASSLRSRSIGKLALDEVDSYKANIQGEGDPILLAERRTSNFPDCKIFRISTPAIDETSRIHPLYEMGDQRQYYLPCPHCNASAEKKGTYFVLKWKNIIWDKGKPDTVRLVCPVCGCEIEEHYKTWMLEHGEWRPQNPHTKNQKPGNTSVQSASFFISALYSPLGFFSWTDAARMFEEASRSKDREQLKVFVNTVLGETWKESDQGMSYELIKNRCEIYSQDGTFDIPLGVRILTAGADVQGDRIECEVLGHGAAGETWSIEYKVFYGDTSQDQVWQEFDLFLQKKYRHQAGIMMNVSGVAVDSGFQSKKVYAFCKSREHRRIFPIKGRSAWGKGTISRPRKPNEYGVWLFILYVDEIKLKIMSTLKEASAGPQFCHFPKNEMYGENYFKGLTAEVLTRTRRGGRAVLDWVLPKGARNEALDCRCYNLAMLEILGVDMNVLVEKNILMTNTQVGPQQQKKAVTNSRRHIMMR